MQRMSFFTDKGRVVVVSKQGAGEAPKCNGELVLISREALEFTV